jgi:hypothetical protein
MEFRETMIGRQLSAVTIEDGGSAVSGNYLKVTLASRRTPNQIVNIKIGGINPTGLNEEGTLSVI